VQLATTVVTASGNLSITGVAGDTGEAVELDATTLNVTGSITIDGTGDDASGVDFNTGTSITAGGNVTVTGRTATGTWAIDFLDTFTLNGSTGVTIVGDKISLVDTATTIEGGGPLVIESEGPTFNSSLTTEGLTFGTSFSSARIGKTTNTGSVTIGSEGLNVAGPIAVYGGTTTIDGPLLSTAAGANITVAGNDAIDLGADLTTAQRQHHPRRQHQPDCRRECCHRCSRWRCALQRHD